MAQYPFPRQLAEIANSESSGSLTIRSGSHCKTIVFRDGVPVNVTSNIASESLDRYLISRGEIDESIGHKARTMAATEDRHVGEILVQMGAVEPHALFTALKRNFGKAILSVFAWTNGTSAFDTAAADVDHTLFIKVKPAPLILRGICNFTPINIIQQDFAEYLDRAHRVDKRARHRVGSLQLNTKESRVLNSLGDGATLMQVCEQLGCDHELVFRVLYALYLLDVTELREPSPCAPSAPAARPQDSAESPAAVDVAHAREDADEAHAAPVVSFDSIPTPPPDDEPAENSNAEFEGPKPLTHEEQNDIDAAYLKAKTRDYFELLGISEDFGFDELKRAFLSACDRLSPMSYSNRELGDQGERLEELFLILVRAFSILAVPSTRAEYIASRRKSTEKPKQEERTENAYALRELEGISGDVKAAITLANMGEFSMALQGLSSACKENPKDACARGIRGYCLYLADPVSKGHHALKELVEATRLDPNQSYLFLLLGRVSELHHDRRLALRAYQDCLALTPDEAEALEAVERLKKLT